MPATPPPKDVTPSELFQRLLDRPRPGEIVKFPGLDRPGARGELRMQVLSKQDHDRARLISHGAVKKNATRYGLGALTPQDMASEAVQGVISDLAACEVLAMACTQTEVFAGSDSENERARYPLIFPDGEAVGATLTADEVAYLFSAYTLVQHKYGPHEAICLPEDVNAWVKRLVEGAAENPFLRLSSPQWAELLTSLASKLYDLSGLLESQWSSLPDSLKSGLETYCLGTGSAGEPAESGSPPATLPGPGSELSFEQAVRFANSNFGKPDTE
jgi:hypothetical protein